MRKLVSAIRAQLRARTDRKMLEEEAGDEESGVSEWRHVARACEVDKPHTITRIYKNVGEVQITMLVHD